MLVILVISSLLVVASIKKHSKLKALKDLREDDVVKYYNNKVVRDIRSGVEEKVDLILRLYFMGFDVDHIQPMIRDFLTDVLGYPEHIAEHTYEVPADEALEILEHIRDNFEEYIFEARYSIEDLLEEGYC